MKGRDEIKELFSKKLGNHKVDVNPALWNNIAAKIGTQTAIVSTGVSAGVKIIIATISAAVIVTGIVLYSNSATVETQKITKNTNKEPILELEETINLETNETQVKTNVTPIKNITTPNSENTETIITDETTKVNQTVLVEENITVETQEQEQNTQLVQSTVNNEEETEVVENNTEEENTNEEETTFLDVEKEQLVEGYFIERMPDVFSPNSDGSNDLFFIKSDGLSEFHIVVMNENNRTVFQSSEADFKWNGNDLDGTPAMKGRYVYFITAIDRNGVAVNKYSTLTILR